MAEKEKSLCKQNFKSTDNDKIIAFVWNYSEHGITKLFLYCEWDLFSENSLMDKDELVLLYVIEYSFLRKWQQ